MLGYLPGEPERAGTADEDIIIEDSEFNNCFGGYGCVAVMFNDDATSIKRRVTVRNSKFVQATGNLGSFLYMHVGNSDLSPVIQGNTFVNGTSATHGGAIYMKYRPADPSREAHIQGNTFVNCVASAAGGAVMIEASSSSIVGLNIKNNVFRQNSANLGGAVHLLQGESASMTTVTNPSHVQITGNEFSQNLAIIHGGAISMDI
jgi:hypothetical protein